MRSVSILNAQVINIRIDKKADIKDVGLSQITNITGLSKKDFEQNLVGKKLLIGNIKVEGHDLCRPCKHLEETLNGKDIIKEFLRRGGLRCEILTSGTINLQDKITIL